MKKNLNLSGFNELLSTSQMKSILGGELPGGGGVVCTATASCGTNGSVTCSGYGNGCVAVDDEFVACEDTNGTMKRYNCSVSA